MAKTPKIKAKNTKPTFTEPELIKHPPLEFVYAGTGRPTVVTKEVVVKLEVAFSIGCNVKEACVYAGITPSVFYDWIKKYPEFNDLIEAYGDKLNLKARQAIVNSLDDPQMAKWWASTKIKNEFSTRTELTGKGGGAIPLGFMFDQAEEARKEKPDA